MHASRQSNLQFEAKGQCSCLFFLLISKLKYALKNYHFLDLNQMDLLMIQDKFSVFPVAVFASLILILKKHIL